MKIPNQGNPTQTIPSFTVTSAGKLLPSHALGFLAARVANLRSGMSPSLIFSFPPFYFLEKIAVAAHEV